MAAASTAPSSLQLIEPARAQLEGYAEALALGWSPNNVRDVSAEQLADIRADPAAFLASLLAQGGTIALPDGSTVPKLPVVVRWMWDGAFCGQISLRWQPGSDALPTYVLGHIGYAVVPWKRRRGYATEALRQTLPMARAVGLSCLEITTDKANAASMRVIEANGGRFVEEFVQPSYGAEVRLRYLIDLRSGAREDSPP